MAHVIVRQATEQYFLSVDVGVNEALHELHVRMFIGFLLTVPIILQCLYVRNT